MDKPLWIWITFYCIVFVLLVIDLGFLHKEEREISVKESLKLSAWYIFVSICFGLLVTVYVGATAGKLFFTGYIVEKSLSMDNIMVMAMVFSHFYIPRKYQHRVLFWGILGVIMLRGLMIGLGAALISQFHFILYGFGAFLIVTGVRMLLVAEDDEEKSLEENKILGILRKRIPVTKSLHGRQFFAYEPESGDGGKVLRKATPLFLVLIFIEIADIVFAVDSIPAIFAITTDGFVVYTSNIFAILGLRALFFSLTAMLHRFEYLKYTLSLVLVFIGAKIFIEPWLSISSGVSLLVTILLLASGVLFSLYKTKGQSAAEEDQAGK